MAINSGQTILFIGDSITDCGRRGANRPLGAGYVNFFHDMLVTRSPELDVTIINKGIGGDNVVGLRNRWTDDVLRHRPDILSIKIGINDLHTVLRKNPDPIDPERFDQAYEDILTRTKEELPNCAILIISPFYISVETSPSSFRKDVLDLLPTYIDIARAKSEKHGTSFINTHELFQNLLKHHEADTFCPEPVHPNPVGHLAIAEAVHAILA